MSTTPMKTHHGIHWLPETRAGRWALSLAGASVGGVAVIIVALAAGLDHGGSFTDNWVASLMGVAVFATAAASTVTGLVALSRRHDRSALVIAGTALGVLVLALTLQQVAEGLGWLNS
ncbi:MAG TPA: hypothetical protein VNS55_11115 [Nocardioides sp.]|nr:hypothetical protein [Nocardioides sp.]